MKFNFIKTDYEGGNHWKSDCGTYKIVHYDYYSNGGVCMEKSNYLAYIPDHFFKGKPVFGNRVDSNVKYYNTFDEAVADCKKHAEDQAVTHE
jgi:hypothetical protein